MLRLLLLGALRPTSCISDLLRRVRVEVAACMHVDTNQATLRHTAGEFCQAGFAAEQMA